MYTNKESEIKMNKASIRQARYDKENIVRYSLKFNKNYDKDLIKAIGETNKQAKIKAILRKGLKNGN